MQISTAQKMAIRAIHDHGHRADVTNRTLMSLRRIGMVASDNLLTELGDRTYKGIMATGNGPEELKAMFQF